MYKIILLVLSFCAISGNANSQLSYGVKAGPSLSSLNFDKGGSKIAFHAGGFLAFAVSDKFFLQPELLYSVKGTKTDDVYIADMLLDIEMNYISLPLLAGFEVIPGLKIKAGPEINIPLSITTEVDDDDISDSIIPEPDEMDLSMCGGLSYQFLNNLGAEVRYSHGLSVAYSGTVVDINGSSLGNFGERKTRTWQLSVFYIFGK